MVNYKDRNLGPSPSEKIVSSILRALSAQDKTKDKRILRRELNRALKGFFDDGHGAQKLTLCFDENAADHLKVPLEKIKSIMGRRLTIKVDDTPAPKTPQV